MKLCAAPIVGATVSATTAASAASTLCRQFEFLFMTCTFPLS